MLAVTVGCKLDNLLKNVSSWSKLQKCVSWLLRFVRYLRLKDKSQRALSPKEIIPDEIKGASMAIVRMVQRQHFQDEILALESGKKNKPESRLITLSPILCDGVICVGGRLRHAPLTPENIHPMIVPHQHHIATLIIRFFPSSLRTCRSRTRTVSYPSVLLDY